MMSSQLGDTISLALGMFMIAIGVVLAMIDWKRHAVKFKKD